MKYLLGLIIMVTFALSSLAGLTNLAHAQFDPLKEVCAKPISDQEATDPAKEIDAKPICDASTDPGDPVSGDDGIISKAANMLAVAAAIIAVIVIIVAGITMMTSNGDAGKITNSRNAIIYTVVGLLVIIIARTIVVFVLAKVAS